MRKPTFLKRSIALLSLLCAAPFASANFTISNGQILDPNGNPFVFRGVAIRDDLAPEQTLQSLKDIAAAGANSALIELTRLESNARAKALVQTCRENKLVCVLELNLGNSSATISFPLWNLVDALRGAQDVIIFSAGNQKAGEWLHSREEYQYRMNHGHIPHALLGLGAIAPGFLVMIDGNHWGQDPDKDMLDLAIQNSKLSEFNHIIYSVDMFDDYSSPAAVRDYMESFAQAGIPLVIGGFATSAYRHPNNRTPLKSTSPLPAAAVMQYAQEFGFGYFAWHWGTNEANPLNLAQNWNPLTPTSWGQLALNDVNGIKATAKTATHFFNPSSSASSSSVRSSSTSSSVSSVNPNAPFITLNANTQFIRCGSVDGVASADGSVDPNGDALTYAWEVTGGSYRQEFTGMNIRFGMRPVTQYTIKLTVTDATGLASTKTTSLYSSHLDDCTRSSSSSSVTSSSTVTSSSSSAPAAKATCTYNVNSQWSNGFTGSMRVKNISTQPISGWTVSWQYADSTKVTNAWNATLSGANPYQAKNEGWNSTIQPGQTVEFGFQGSKPAGAAITPTITGGICK
jgi:mannan endo-1,4-beta-mannosidase